MTDAMRKADELLKMPDCDPWEQIAIERYLDYMNAKLALSLLEHQQAAEQSPTKQLRGQIAHIQRQLGVIAWLRSVNNQRKVYYEDSKSG